MRYITFVPRHEFLLALNHTQILWFCIHLMQIEAENFKYDFGNNNIKIELIALSMSLSGGYVWDNLRSLRL